MELIFIQCVQSTLFIWKLILRRLILKRNNLTNLLLHMIAALKNYGNKLLQNMLAKGMKNNVMSDSCIRKLL